MTQQTLRRILTLATLTLLSATPALAQAKPQYVEPALAKDWAQASALAASSSKDSSRSKLYVITLAEPTRRHTCSVQSFTPDQLVCKGSFGTTRTYQPQEVAALITQGDHDYLIRFFIGANSALGAAIWGTIVLAPVCIPCAVATGIAAFLIFDAAGAVAIGDRASDGLLYLAPTQTLQVKLR